MVHTPPAGLPVVCLVQRLTWLLLPIPQQALDVLHMRQSWPRSSAQALCTCQPVTRQGGGPSMLSVPVNAGTTVHSLKLEATFDSPLEHLLALAAEFDLQPLWNKCGPFTAALD